MSDYAWRLLGSFAGGLVGGILGGLGCAATWWLLRRFTR
jgi:tetrahydromethanopterin S-methyltransferase subunit D